MTCVLDSSAILAFLLNEPGAEKVASSLNGALVSSVNLGEIVSVYARTGLSADMIDTLLSRLPIEVVPLSRSVAFAAGMLQPLCASAGLSLGDRVCLALARQEGLPAVSADHAWKTVAKDVGVTIDIIR